MSLSTPVVSVVMPLYNKAAEIRRSVESVLNQTVSDFELIVVNDGSTDNGPEVVRSINDSRIKNIDQENAGVSAARNRGIHEARADLIAFLDADDEWKSTFLETVLKLKKKFQACSVFATNYLYREDDGKYRFPIIRGIPSHPWEGVLEDYFGIALRSDPPLCSSAVAVTKAAIQSVRLFPVGVTSGEDLLTWARLAVNYNIAYSTRPESIFWLRMPPTGRPTRTPAEDDFVGRALESLLSTVSADNKETFRKYIGLWHRMRASMYLRLGMKREASREVKKMIRYAKKDFKLLVFTAMVFSPDVMSKKLIKSLNIAKSIRRSFYTS